MSNAHGEPSPEMVARVGRYADLVDGWRPPELVGRPEQVTLRALEPGSTDLEWIDHPLGHIGPYAYPFRACWWCGGMHPDDLLALMGAGGIILDEADWKYGWPHKYYVRGVPNPLVGQTVCSGGRYGSLDPTEHLLGPAPVTTFAKFYTVHVADATDFSALAAQLTARIPNVEWSRKDDGSLAWYGHRGSGVR